MLNSGSVDASFALFLPPPPDTADHISETKAWMKKYRPPRSLSGLWLLVDHQKPHIRELFVEVWKVDCCGVLQICI